VNEHRLTYLTRDIQSDLRKISRLLVALFIVNAIFWGCMIAEARAVRSALTTLSDQTK
jgi:G:T-mismatch repair DNA endonuclease (very short patch repair protein)